MSLWYLDFEFPDYKSKSRVAESNDNSILGFWKNLQLSSTVAVPVSFLTTFFLLHSESLNLVAQELWPFIAPWHFTSLVFLRCNLYSCGFGLEELLIEQLTFESSIPGSLNTK